MKSATTLLVFCVSSLLALGLVMMYSAGDVQKAGGTVFFISQLVSAAVGFTACLFMVLIPYQTLKKVVWLLVSVAVLLLICVLTTDKVNGSRRWLKVPGVGFSFQPSELAKLALLVFVAWYGERYQHVLKSFKRGVFYPALVVGSMVGLVLLEPDVGTALLMLGLAAILLLLAGIQWRYGVLLALVVALGLAYIIKYEPVRSDRIYAWLHPEETKKGVGFQAWEARVAFGAGGLTGRGLGSSRQKLGFVAENHTDFIFPIVGEELGLIATTAVVIVYLLLLGAGFHIATRAPDLFGVLLGGGITLMIGLQAFVNIAVVTGVFPNKGLPLPFISHGGSNLILLLGCTGILLNIARQAQSEVQDGAYDLPDAHALTPHMT